MMAKAKKGNEETNNIPLKENPIVEVQPEEKETFNLAEAELMQKSGEWILLEIRQTSDGKLYKFKKGN